jgi:hypothetical protein
MFMIKLNSGREDSKIEKNGVDYTVKTELPLFFCYC